LHLSSLDPVMGCVRAGTDAQGARKEGDQERPCAICLGVLQAIDILPCPEPSTGTVAAVQQAHGSVPGWMPLTTCSAAAIAETVRCAATDSADAWCPPPQTKPYSPLKQREQLSRSNLNAYRERHSPLLTLSLQSLDNACRKEGHNLSCALSLDVTLPGATQVGTSSHTKRHRGGTVIIGAVLIL
jgi:hypothetical protein